MENGKAVNNLSSYYEKKSTPTIKAYRNSEYLNSSEARTIRIQCELEESKWRLKKEGVKGTRGNDACKSLHAFHFYGNSINFFFSYRARLWICQSEVQNAI